MQCLVSQGIIKRKLSTHWDIAIQSSISISDMGHSSLVNVADFWYLYLIIDLLITHTHTHTHNFNMLINYADLLAHICDSYARGALED